VTFGGEVKDQIESFSLEERANRDFISNIDSRERDAILVQQCR
jgi:hypothetical protein